MGFWHTGYMEFHEPSGIEEWCRPDPPTYRCSHCGKDFENAAALRHHRFEMHPFKRPLLFIRGMEIGSSPITITRELKSSEINAGACSRAIVNGKKMSVDHLPDTLASIEQDTVKIVLEGEGAAASFEIRIEIATDEDLSGIEKNFFNVARLSRLDVRAIDQFIEGAAEFSTATDYCDGICDYLYGVLAKERSSSSSLPYEAYREKFSRSLDKLQMFDRPLANRIGGLINFHYNHFWESASLVPESRVGHASEKFSGWLSGISTAERNADFLEKDSSFESMLTDWDTEQLISLAVKEPSRLVSYEGHMQKMLSEFRAEFDKTKLHILLAKMGLASRNEALVKAHAKVLRNSPGVAHWANAVIEESKSWRGS